MKSTIQAEAEKAAEKIREALEEFNRVTGFAADPDARWVETSVLREACSSTRLAYVALRIGGIEVKA